MAFIPDDNMQSSLDKVIDYVAPESNNATFKEKMTASFRLDNTLISAISQEGGLPDGVADTDYDVFSKLTDDEKTNDRFVRQAALSDNDNELEAVRAQYKREIEDREKITGVDGYLTSLMAGTVDYVSLIPIGGAAAKAYQSGNILKGGLITGTAAAGSVGLTELELHRTQLTRTGDESLMNVTGGMLLGGALGSSVAAFNKGLLNKAAKEIEEIFDSPESPNIVRESDSAGAAAVWGDVRIKGKNVEKALKSIKSIDPLARVMTAKSKLARKYGAMLFENPLEVEGMTGRSVEQSAKTKKQAYFGRALTAHLDSFTEAKKNGFKGKRGEFNQLVSKEVANPGSTDNIYAAKSAKAWEKEVYSKTSKELQELGMLGDELDVQTAQKYLNRRWNKEKVGGNLKEFNAVVSKWLKENQPDLEDADDLADQIAMRIMGTPDGMIRYDHEYQTKSGGGGGLRAPFKQRKFLIPDELVEQFLDRDIEQLASVYLSHTVPDMELVRAFGDKKTPVEDVLNFENIKSDIQRDYTNMAKDAKSQKEALKIKAEGDKVIEAMAGMRDRMRGLYDLPEGRPSIGRRVNAAARNLNYVRLMGGVLASSIPDIGKQVMSEGFMRAFGDGFIPLVKNISKFKMDSSLKAEMRYNGIAMDTVTSGRVEALADISDYSLGNTKAERGLEYVANKFGNIALINQWNDSMKTSHALAMQARVFDDLSKGNFDNRLSKLGLTKEEAEGIYQQAKKHGRVQDGARLFNPQAWERQDLAFAWAAALRKESDRVVIIPGQEKPLFMSRDLGKTILQFRSFMLASTQRTLLSAAQGQEANVLGGMLTMITLGSMVYAFKQWDAGKEISDDPRVWIAEGIDRSGALGILTEASNTLEKISGNRIGLRAALGIAEPASRFASRNTTETILGATYGSALSTVVKVGQAGLSQNEWQRSDTTAIRRLMPFQNLTFLRRGIDAVEEKIHEDIIK